MALRNKRRVDVLGPVPTHPSHPNEPASNTDPHWPDGSCGNEISPAQSVVIHGTGGWPSHASAGNVRGAEKLAGNPLVTWHAEEMNGLSVGIENSDVADSGSTPTNAGRSYILIAAA
jgi:hypothetical protein